jgi:hypothetical protein
MEQWVIAVNPYTGQTRDRLRNFPILAGLKDKCCEPFVARGFVIIREKVVKRQ